MKMLQSSTRRLALLLVSTTGIILGAPAQADLVVIDFDAEPSSACLALGASFTTQGFVFTSPTDTLFSCDGTAPSLASNGTPSLIDANFISRPSMTAENGRAFSLVRFDAAERNSSGLNNATSIRVEGARFDGTTVVANFTLDGINDGPGGAGDFETFVLPASFRDLASVTFFAEPEVIRTEFLMDNLVVEVTRVIDFESIPTGTCRLYGASLSTQGFTFTSPTNSLFSCDGTLSNLASNGSASLIDANFFSTPTMVEDNGIPFSLLSFDAAERNSSGAGNSTGIRVEGTRVDGSTVATVFTFDGAVDGPGGVEDFESFRLPASFQGIVSVVFIAQPPVDPSEFFLDNIEVEVAEVVDFESEPSGACAFYGATLTTQRFTFASPTNNLFSCDGTFPPFASNGTASLIDANSFSTPTMTEENDRLFNLHHFDGAERNISGTGNATSIRVEGTRSDGSLVVADFPLDGINDGPGGVVDFETFVLPSTFNSLVSVEFIAQPPVSRSEFFLDNLAVTRTIRNVVDFDSELSGICRLYGPSLTTQGFSFTSPTDSLFSCNGLPPSLASNGTASLIDANSFSTPTMVDASGNPFRLWSFDAAERNVSGVGNATGIRVEATRLDGANIVANFTFDGINDGPGGVDDFDTFVLPASFQEGGGLTSVNFEAQPAATPSEFLIDNINVPEPTSGMGLLAGLAGLAGLARRRLRASLG